MSNDDLSARLRSSLDRGAAPELSTDVVSGAASHPAPRLTNPARTLRIAGGAGVAVALVTVGALVVAPTLNRPPLFIAAGASDRSVASAADTTAESMKIGWWVDYHYTAGAGLSTSGGDGQVYQLVLDGDAQERAAEIAGIFGVNGDVAAASYSDASYPTWMVGPEDGSAPSVTVTWSGTGDWWYSDPAANSFWVCDASVPVAEAADYGCVLPENAPENLAPSEDEARAQAQELLASTGMDVSASDITTYAEDWGTTATANLQVNGVKTALDWTINWSNTGAISYAYGHSVTVESRGSYGTVSPVAAVDRLADGRWWGSAGPDYQGGAVLYAADTALRSAEVAPVPEALEGTPEPAPDVPTDPGPTADPAPTEIPVDPVPTEPLPVEPLPEPTPEVVEVTVDTAEATLLLMWDADGNAWLVPGYAMQVDNGGWSSVVSLVDGIIALPEPIEVEPLVGDGGVAY